MFYKFLHIFFIFNYLRFFAHLTELRPEAMISFYPKQGIMIDPKPCLSAAHHQRNQTTHPDHPFLLDFIVDAGEEPCAGERILRNGTGETVFIKYFHGFFGPFPEKKDPLGQFIPPYEKERTVPDVLGQNGLWGAIYWAQRLYFETKSPRLWFYPEKKNWGRNFGDKIYTQSPGKPTAQVKFPVN